MTLTICLAYAFSSSGRTSGPTVQNGSAYRKRQAHLQLAARTDCPEATNHDGDELVYNCVTQFVDLQGNANGVRVGRAHDPSGRGGFGITHYKLDHHAENRGVQLPCRTHPHRAWAATAFATPTFVVADRGLIAFRVIVNRAR